LKLLHCRGLLERAGFDGADQLLSHRAGVHVAVELAALVVGQLDAFERGVELGAGMVGCYEVVRFFLSQQLPAHCIGHLSVKL
jgi:hypothetical protein